MLHVDGMQAQGETEAAVLKLRVCANALMHVEERGMLKNMS